MGMRVYARCVLLLRKPEAMVCFIGALGRPVPFSHECSTGLKGTASDNVGIRSRGNSLSKPLWKTHIVKKCLSLMPCGSV